MPGDEKLIKFADFFEISGYSFKFIGLNPYFECKKKTSAIRRFFDSALYHFCFWLTALTTLLEIMFFTSILGDMAHFLDFCKTLSCALYDLMAVLEMVLIWYAGEKFNDFILELEGIFPTDHETQKKYGIFKQAMDTKLMLKNVLSAFVFCFFTWVVGSPTYDILYCYYTNKKYVLELPFKIYSPWSLDEPIPYYVAFFLEFVTMYTSVVIVVSVNMFFVAIVAQLRLQFVMLAQTIRDLVPNDVRGLHNVVRLHIRLIKISEQFAELISWTMFINHLLSSGAICCALFEVVTSQTSEIFRFLVYLMVVIIQTFTMSFVGDSLAEHSLKIPDAVYESDWLDSSKSMQLCLLQVMHRSQKPLRVTGKGFFVISLESFTKILTTSFSYYALLRSFIE